MSSFVNSIGAITTRYYKPDLIFLTGDIAYSGKAEEYEAATAILDKILEVTGLDRTLLFLVPGNHDVDRNGGVGLVRTLTSVDEADIYFTPSQDKLHTEKRMKSFISWYDKYFEGIRSFAANESFKIESVSVRGRKVCISLFNSGIFCSGDDDQGKLFVGRRSVELASKQIRESKPDLAIALMHHPISWLSEIEAIHVKALIRDGFDCLLTGHLHSNEVENIAGSSGSILHFCAGATYQTRKWPNTAILCSYNADVFTVTPIHFTDSPRPVWTLDTSLFSDSPTYQGSYSISRAEKLAFVTDTTRTELSGGVALGSAPSEGALEIEAIRAQIDERLFANPAGGSIYVEPRLVERSQVAALESSDNAIVTLADIAKSKESFFIESRPEFGASTLCRLLQLAIVENFGKAIVRSSRDLPNYRKKLEAELGISVANTEAKYTLILDDFDLERDERLLSELKASGWFPRIIMISVNRRINENVLLEPSTMPFSPKVLYHWAMGRQEIRTFASLILDANDAISEARAVDKVYSDLLALRIPLTPSNVIMYLRVLQREGDFEPLSRVDILSRYLAESLRKPSDLANDSFNFKNKMDVLSSFSFYLHSNKMSDFDERVWLNFCENYQKRTLSEFDAKSFMGELVESRVWGIYGGLLFFRYSFYYTFFLGRYLWPRPSDIREFFRSEDYLLNHSVIDVITGLSSENSEILNIITEILERYLEEFSVKYVRPEFDPLVDATWPNSIDEDEQLWAPVQKAIESGPAETGVIDQLKTSLLKESRTDDQRVTFVQFNELEHAIYRSATILMDALKNSDDVDGQAKIRAWVALLKTDLTALQVGTIFAEQLAKRKRFSWGGLGFTNFDKAVALDEKRHHQNIVQVVTELVDAIAVKVSHECASIKLASVFRAAADDESFGGFLSVLNFCCIATARGRGWAQTSAVIIERTDKNAYYLRVMLDHLLRLLRYELMSGRDREALKRLIALIQAKRVHSKQSPGAKAVTKMVDHLTKRDYYPEASDDAP